MSISLGIDLVSNLVYMTTSLYDFGKCKYKPYFLTCSVGVKLLLVLSLAGLKEIKCVTRLAQFLVL